MLRVLLVMSMLLAMPMDVFGQNENKYIGISQSDWAVVLVRSLNLDVDRELVNIEDFTTILNEKGIAPKEGWKVNQKLTYQDFAGTIGLTLIFLNSQDSKNKTADFNKFLSFLDDKIGLNIAQLLASLPKSENLRNLNEGVSNYLAQKQSSSTENNNPALTTGNQAGSKTKTSTQQSAQLAAVSSTISSLAQALSVYTAGESNTDYWNIFSKPASPVLPNL